MVVDDPDQRDEIGARGQRVGEEVAADGLGAAGEARRGEARLGALGHGGRSNSRQLQRRRRLRHGA